MDFWTIYALRRFPCTLCSIILAVRHPRIDSSSGTPYEGCAWGLKIGSITLISLTSLKAWSCVKILFTFVICIVARITLSLPPIPKWAYLARNSNALFVICASRLTSVRLESLYDIHPFPEFFLIQIAQIVRYFHQRNVIDNDSFIDCRTYSL